MKLKELSQRIEQDTFESGGASYTIEGETPPDNGYMVSLPEMERRIHTTVFNERVTLRYIGQKLVQLCHLSDVYIGTWLDREAEEVYLDVSVWVEDEELARDLGELGKQKAIYNLATGETINL